MLPGMTPGHLFEAPRDRLGSRTHDEVFGGLPPATCRALDRPEVAEAVRALLGHGWRPAQIGARVGALPAADEPLPAVLAFLESLLERDNPQRAWAERAARLRPDPTVPPTPPASTEVRERWAAHARAALSGSSRGIARAVPRAPARVCAACGGEGAFFVTVDVRLCSDCVGLLSTGRARLAVGA